jgi:DNA-binding response OmpR family regulator
MARKILLADEARTARELLAQLLDRKGYEVVEAGDGREALTLALEIDPDLVILEALLPYQSGFEVVAALRRHPRARSIPILMTCSITRGLGHPDDYWRQRVDADDFLSKPFSLAEMFARVDALIGPGETESAASIERPAVPPQ